VHEASKSLKSDTNAERDHKRKVMQAFEQLQGQTKQKIVKSKEEIRNKVAGVRRQQARAHDKRQESLDKQCRKNREAGKEALAKNCAKREAAEKAERRKDPEENQGS